MNTSQFMDKQIMDLSNSQSNNNNDFLDLITPAGGDSDKEEILPSYDFQPIRPAGSSSPPSKLDAAGAPRAWNSADNNNASASGTRNYTSVDSYEPARYVIEKDQAAVDSNLVSEIDRTMKKHADNLMHGLDGISARVSQLESRTRHLESSLDELKVSIGTNYGSSDGRMRLLENILREVQNGVQTIRDKQDIMDARLELAKLQRPKAEQHADIQSTEHVDSSQAAMSVNQQSHQQFSPAPLTHPSSAPPPNDPPPPTSQHNIPPQFQLPGHFPPGQIPSVPPRKSYFVPPPPGQAPENPSQQYQLPPSQPQPQPQHQYQLPPQLQYSQPPAPPQPHNPLPTTVPSQPHIPPTHHHPEESPYGPSQTYPPALRQNPPPPPPPNAAPPQQQFYGAPATMYEPPPSRPGPGFSGSFGPSTGSGEQFPYGSPSSQYGSPVKPQQMSSSASSGYPQLPTARILPHAVPTASTVGSGPGSPASGNKVPIDDVVDKVTSMGFSREQVRATVRRLTENGQSVDLNVVLDKLMNDGDVQPPRGWFSR